MANGTHQMVETQPSEDYCVNLQWCCQLNMMVKINCRMIILGEQKKLKLREADVKIQNEDSTCTYIEPGCCRLIAGYE